MVVVGGWVVLESHFSIQLKPKPRGMTSIVLCPPHLNKKPCYLWQVKCLLSTNIVRLCFIVLTPRNILPLTRLFVFAEIISETCKAEKKGTSSLCSICLPNHIVHFPFAAPNQLILPIFNYHYFSFRKKPIRLLKFILPKKAF